VGVFVCAIVIGRNIIMLLELFGLEKRNTLVVTGAGVGQDATLNKIFGTMGKTSSGVNVTEDTAQTFAAVYRAVTLISSTIASLPLHVYRWNGTEGDKEEARDHPVFQILHRRPNPAMTSFFCRQAALAYVLLYGRHFSFIETDGRGEVVGLWPMRTPDVERIRKDGELKYDVRRVRDNDLFPRPPFRGDRPFLLANEVMELSTFDGESIIGHAREQVGEALAAQSFGGGFYAGGAQPYMVITSPGGIDAEEFAKNWATVHGGSKRKLAVLDKGKDIKTVSMPLNDAQFLESRKFYVTEIARWFGIPPHKLMDLERATFSNIEEQNLEWYESLIPWLEMIEQEADRQLLVGDTTDYFCEHNVDGLLRGNIAARYTAYATGIQWGWLNRNQVRRRENQNSMGAEGDVYMVPANMARADALAGAPEPEPVAPTDTAVDATPAEPVADALEATAQEIQTLPDATLNGAQIAAAVEIVKAVALEELPRDAGIGGLTVLLNLTPEQAAAVMGSVGAGFKAVKPEPPQPFGQPPKPKEEPNPEEKVNSTIKGAAKAGLIQAASRMLAKESADIRQATQHPETFNQWLDEYRAKWPARWEHGMAAAVAASRGIGVDVDASMPVWEQRCQIGVDALNELSGHVKRDELASRVAAEVDGWPTAEQIVNQLTKEQ
jgi:HK97 family phage portal protein